MQLHRKQRPDVEVFARFMEEFYGQKELSFFQEELSTSGTAGSRGSGGAM